MAKKQIVIDTGSSKTTGTGTSVSNANDMDGSGLSDRPPIDGSDGAQSKGDGDAPDLDIDGKKRGADGADGGDNAGGTKGIEGTSVSDQTLEIEGTTYKLDTDGNALDDTGKVFKTKDEIDAIGSSVEQIQIGDDVFTLDADGNAVNDKQEVSYTAAEIAEMEEVSDETPPAIDLTKIQDVTKIQLSDANGKAKEYTNDETGLLEYVNDVYEYGARTEVTRAMNDLVGRYPIINQVIDHLNLNNGSMDNFNATPDYSKIKLGKDNEAQLKAIIFEGRRSRGETDEQINKYYDYIKNTDTDNDQILDLANTELTYLKGVADNKEQQRQAAIAGRQQQDAIKAQNYWGYTTNEEGQLVNLNVPNSVYDLINKRTLKISDEDTFQIPDKIKRVENGKTVLKSTDDFFNYLTVPQTYILPNGERVQMTQHDYDIQVEDTRRNTSSDVYDAFKRYVGYDTSQYVREQVNRESVKQVRKKLIPKSNKGGGGSTTRKPTVRKKIVIKTSE